MRICIFGAGAVGGYLAGNLARGGATISAVARGAHLAAIRARGLTVETPDDTFNVRIAASDNPADLGAAAGDIGGSDRREGPRARTLSSHLKGKKSRLSEFCPDRPDGGPGLSTGRPAWAAM